MTSGRTLIYSVNGEVSSCPGSRIAARVEAIKISTMDREILNRGETHQESASLESRALRTRIPLCS